MSHKENILFYTSVIINNIEYLPNFYFKTQKEKNILKYEQKYNFINIKILMKFVKSRKFVIIKTNV